MANKINVKLILELHAKSMSRNAIAASRHMSKNSVGEVIHLSGLLDIRYEDVMAKDEAEVYRMFYPDKHSVERLFRPPDYEYIHNELKKTGVTLKLLWQEYCDTGSSFGQVPAGYTKFCRGYSEYTVAQRITSHIEHKPGVTVEVDWSGPTMSYLDVPTGELITVYLFVATLPYSQYSYVELCLDMKQATWLLCHVHMYEFFDGVPARTVCDNLKTGVISHPREGDIVLNADYESLGMHYMTAILPTGVRKPKHKPSVEGTVGKVATAIIARHRHERFHSFEALNSAVMVSLNEFNAQPFQKRDGSRKDVYEVERLSLQPLPAFPYEICTWFYGRLVNFDCHVLYDKNRYSCPYQYVGAKADVKVTRNSVELYVNGERVATHVRYPDYISNQRSTHPGHIPEKFLKPQWDDGRIMNWADSIGPNTGEVVRRILAASKIKEQGYNPSLSVLRLSKRYDNSRLENACKIALAGINVPRYHHVNAILAANQDLSYAQSTVREVSGNQDRQEGYVRGAAYYGGRDNDK